MVKKFVLGVILIGLVLFLSLLTIKAKDKNIAPENRNTLINPVVIEESVNPFEGLLGLSPKKEEPIIENKNTLNSGDVLSLLLLGIDRRSRAEASYRTDIMIQMIVNTKTNSVVLASAPRDLWVGGQRLNAVFVANGWEILQDEFETLTGFKPERFILTDFADFSWIIDAMGGVPVKVERSFVDSSYPVDETLGYQTVEFVEGPELLTGSRALIFSRSRKGSNGEGSDWARMKRQHLILNGMLTAITQPASMFRNMSVEETYNTVTLNRMDTNLSVTDTKFLWDFYKDKELYTVNSMFLDGDYVYNPPMEDYGGAWVLIPQADGLERFKSEIKTYLKMH